MSESPTAVSLFSSGGIGDIALHAAGVRTLVASEILAERAALFQQNFPEATLVVGDIWQTASKIISTAESRLRGGELDIIFATPPCQGMSKNGRGKLLQGIRAGRKPTLDVRNQLMLPTLDVVTALRPKVFVVENVPEMEQTIILSRDGRYIGLLDLIDEILTPLGYTGRSSVIEFADYGVPQRRQRLITVFSRIPSVQAAFLTKQWLPQPTHAKRPSLLEKPWITVEQTIGHLPPLDAGSPQTAKSEIPLHRVPLLDESKYFWVSNTPPGGGAFDNQCVAIDCGYDGNATHGNQRSAGGINQSSKTTPVRCQKCGSLLPRPWVIRDGEHCLMSGFTSAYKRMRGDLPASALTRNLSYACSDQKLHPTQNRVLSLYEACLIHTIDENQYSWIRADGGRVSDKLIRDVIGESIPPLGLKAIFDHILGLVRTDRMLSAA
ncbi:DNA cytosine methyltransferase [Brevundimonas sp. SORGH_AS_0993]|uniref:DNA cytosine methyltransferase n=1 Tax=Brevundimonas sp. SORGH_AS_0993 TaxID=3041794 RepID=UPI00278AFEC5|nr:DNA cytosine methyltransferase [Brevundimonas sp. SORGH_AS_0993]MDQ1154272.1 DNA (cytosine-5)-methyltransferase 1 [Brevundimonas sp. SORGH_AS_0993]